MYSIQTRNTIAEVIYKNDHVNNIYEACTCCYDNTKCISYEEKKEYISKRINAGHESMLEHGKLAIKISNIPNTDIITELTTLEYSKWLQFYSIQKEDDEWNLIINGDMRSFKHFFVNTTENDYERNLLIRLMHILLINNTVGALYGNTFKAYIEEKPEFVEIEGYFEEQENELDAIISPHTGIEYDTITESNIDTVSTTNNGEKSIVFGIDTLGINRLIIDPDVSMQVLSRIIPVTILFKNMSRTATHQLVRHRNAITQESQRYVSSSDATFSIPVPDYKEEDKHRITLFGTTKEVSLTELADELMAVYNQLVNSGLKKEEARAYLPSNVNCRRLYMTFTLESLIAFLDLRCDEHAQYEIRQYALKIKETSDSIIERIKDNF